MCKRNLLLVTCVALTWSGLAAAQATHGGAQAQGGSQRASAASQTAGTPQTAAGTPSAQGAQAPVRQPSTSPSPAAPPPAAQTSPTPSAATPASNSSSASSPSSMPQQTTVPNTPNAAQSAADRSRIATQTYSVVPPASRGVGTTANRPDCSQMRGLEKSECERRDTSRDDLPAGVTTTQKPQPPR